MKPGDFVRLKESFTIRQVAQYRGTRRALVAGEHGWITTECSVNDRGQSVPWVRFMDGYLAAVNPVWLKKVENPDEHNG